MTYRNDSATSFTTGNITFLTTGKVGPTSPSGFFNNVNNVLAPTISRIETLATAGNVTNFDFWELINWMFVSQYWLLLLDFGQIAPSTFNYDAQGNLINYGPVKHSPQYNIFFNETLFDQYNSYLRGTILPLFGYTLTPFRPLNEANRMNASTVSLNMLYTCTDLKLKDSAGLIISIIVADWAMLTSVFALVVFLLAVWKLRSVEYGIIPHSEEY